MCLSASCLVYRLLLGTQGFSDFPEGVCHSMIPETSPLASGGAFQAYHLCQNPIGLAQTPEAPSDPARPIWISISDVGFTFQFQLPQQS